jgi:2-polyprenyl-3-methyl-5-hydroxy-6-metoxy-1,4-benzoquinol methylase
MSFNFHYDRKKYFDQQYQNTMKYIIPFISKTYDLANKSLLEIGCGEGGVLKAFYELGSNITGIDLAPNKIENAKKYYSELKQINSYEFRAENIYDFDFNSLNQFDLIILKDAIEHIHDQKKMINFLAENMKQNSHLFVAYPPWQMPWGGHQQICKNKFLSFLPYFHLFLNFIYKGILKLFGEAQSTIESLLEIKETRISIERFEKIIKECNLKITTKRFYFINPNYEVKFGLKPRLQNRFISKIPYLRGFFTTTCYYLIEKK